MAFDVSTTAAELAPPPASAPAPVPAPEPAATSPGLSAVPGKTNGATVSEVSHLPDGGNEPPKKGGRPTLTRIK
jgi:stringent starvation protein B